MITAPYPISPRFGPLAAPSEEEAEEAYAELRDRALTLAWAAVALGRQPAELRLLADAGELVLLPGPWQMRQADDPGCFVPAWQLVAGTGGPHPALPTVIAAAADVCWTSLRLHRFMTTPLEVEACTPASLLHAGDADRVAALIRGELAASSVARPTTMRRRRHPRNPLPALRGATSRERRRRADRGARPPCEASRPARPRSAVRRPR